MDCGVRPCLFLSVFMFQRPVPRERRFVDVTCSVLGGRAGRRGGAVHGVRAADGGRLVLCTSPVWLVLARAEVGGVLERDRTQQVEETVAVVVVSGKVEVAAGPTYRTSASSHIWACRH